MLVGFQNVRPETLFAWEELGTMWTIERTKDRNLTLTILLWFLTESFISRWWWNSTGRAVKITIRAWSRRWFDRIPIWLNWWYGILNYHAVCTTWIKLWSFMLKINVIIGWHIDVEQLLTKSKRLQGWLEWRWYAVRSDLICAKGFKRNTRRRNSAFMMDLTRKEFGVDIISPPIWIEGIIIHNLAIQLKRYQLWWLVKKLRLARLTWPAEF